MNGERRYFVADNGWFEFEVKLCTAMIGILQIVNKVQQGYSIQKYDRSFRQTDEAGAEIISTSTFSSIFFNDGPPLHVHAVVGIGEYLRWRTFMNLANQARYYNNMF